MDVSPFPYQGPLDPVQVRGRDELLADLVERVSEHRVTALLGPRRYGKTSLLRRVAAEVETAGTRVVWVDLYEVSSMADLAARIDQSLVAVGAADDRVGKLATSVELHLGMVRIDLRKPASSRPDPLLTVHAQLDVIGGLARQTPVLVVFDEFAGIERVDGAAGLLRTHLQMQYTELGLVFAGSEPSMMRALFADQQQPFYAQADLVEIGPLAQRDVVEMITDGFRATGRQAADLGFRVAEFTGGHPQRSMQVADAAWRLVAEGAAAGSDTWAETLDAVRAASASGLERLYSSLAARQRDVLRIIARDGSPFGAAAELFELSTGAAQHARRSLLDAGHLHIVGRRTQLVDPVFADWIRQRFPI
ncbi:MAG: AAA family ATPase [Ilumatobacteraceae bacterium]